MANTLRLEIVTPEGAVCDEQVEMVTLPGVEGELGIYPQHAPLMTQIAPGELVVRRGGRDDLMAVGPGFVEITAGRVAILTDVAIKEADLDDDARAEQARAAAEVRLRERLGDEDAAVVNAAIVRAIAELRGRHQRRRH